MFKRFFLFFEGILRVFKRFFQCKKKLFFKTLHQEMYPKKHDGYSWNFACTHVIFAHVFNGGAIARGAVLT